MQVYVCTQYPEETNLGLDVLRGRMLFEEQFPEVYITVIRSEQLILDQNCFHKPSGDSIITQNV